MKIIIIKAQSTLVLAIAFLGLSMTTSRSAKAIIININSRANNHINNPVLVPLDAGTYNIETIGINEGGLYNAYSVWASTSCTNPDGCQQTFPTTVRGWFTRYGVFSPNISSVKVEGVELVLDAVSVDANEDQFTTAFGPNYFSLIDGKVYADAVTALDASREVEFVLDAPDSIGISLHDSPGFFGDNRGGLSLRINAVPEPLTILGTSTAAGFGAFFKRTINKKKKDKK